MDSEGSTSTVFRANTKPEGTLGSIGGAGSAISIRGGVGMTALRGRDARNRAGGIARG